MDFYSSFLLLNLEHLERYTPLNDMFFFLGFSREESILLSAADLFKYV